MHIIVSAMSVVYLVGMLVSELTAIGACLLAISPGFPSLATTLSIVLVTNFYSAIGGLPASMLTDKSVSGPIPLAKACPSLSFQTSRYSDYIVGCRLLWRNFGFGRYNVVLHALRSFRVLGDKKNRFCLVVECQHLAVRGLFPHSLYCVSIYYKIKLQGVVTGLTLIFACFIVEQLNQSTWQRVSLTFL